MANTIQGFTTYRPWRIVARHPDLPSATIEWFATKEAAIEEAKRFTGCTVRVQLFFSWDDRPFDHSSIVNPEPQEATHAIHHTSRRSTHGLA
jgi:hypothetical protein